MCSCNNSDASKSNSSKTSSEEASKAQDNISDEDMVKGELEKLFYDIANQKNEKFQWMTKELISEYFSEDEIAEQGNGSYFKMFYEHPEEMKQEVLRAMKEIHSNFAEKGFDWNDYSIESVNIEDKEDVPKFKWTWYKGKAKIKSAGKDFTFEFKSFLVIKGAARFLDGMDLEPVND